MIFRLLRSTDAARPVQVQIYAHYGSVTTPGPGNDGQEITAGACGNDRHRDRRRRRLAAKAAPSRGQPCRAIGRGPTEREGAAKITNLRPLYPQFLPDLLHSSTTGESVPDPHIATGCCSLRSHPYWASSRSQVELGRLSQSFSQSRSTFN
jgi:hypothetical protein